MISYLSLAAKSVLAATVGTDVPDKARHEYDSILRYVMEFKTSPTNSES